MGGRSRCRVDHAGVNLAARAARPEILRRWLPGGRLEGDEYVVRNPTRDDRRPGNFKINVRNGLWCDLATGDAGRGAISLAAYLFRTNYAEASRRLERMLRESQ